MAGGESTLSESSLDKQDKDVGTKTNPTRKIMSPSFMRTTSSSLQKSAGPIRNSANRTEGPGQTKKKISESRSIETGSRLPSSSKPAGLPVKKIAKLASFTKSSRRMSTRENRAVRSSSEKKVTVESTTLCPYSYCSLHGHHLDLPPFDLLDRRDQREADHCCDTAAECDNTVNSESSISTNSSYSPEALSDVNRRKNDSGLWHLIHRKMVSGLSADDGSQTGNEKNSSADEKATDVLQQSAIILMKEALSKILEKIPDDNAQSDNAEDGKPGRKSFKNWSRVKKLILLKRFVAIIEQAKSIQETELLEPGKLNLRDSVVEDRRASEEWMVDYALQRVIATLPSIEKKKVALLVQAFETVLPPIATDSPKTFPCTQETSQKEESVSPLWRMVYKHMAAVDDTATEPTVKDEDPQSPNEEAVRLVEEAIDDIGLHSDEDHPIETRENAGNSRPRRNWGNAKKLLLVQRFMKTMESVKKVSRQKFDSSETERIKLRHNEVRGARNAEEWMLDHALQRVVSQLTPERKKKVQLLVEAFETVDKF